MGMERAAAAARAVPAGPSAGEAGLTLAALIDVLDRADEVLVRTRPRPRRAVMHRTPGTRTVADRWDPLRDLDADRAPAARRPGSTSRAVVRTGGTDRPVPRSAPRSAPRVVHARVVPLRSVPPAPPARVAVAPAPTSTPTPAPARRPAASRLRAALGALLRRAALWGAGPGGAYLAWNAPPPARVYRGTTSSAPARTVDPPVVLRELPSTPTAPPAPRPVPTPAPPAQGRAGAAHRGAPVRALRTPALSTVRRIPPLPPAPGAVPSRARSPGGVRGSPGSPSARGSPPWWPEPG